MYRIYVSDENLNITIEVLDREYIENDLDNGGRIIINDEDIEVAENLLYDAGIEFETI